MHHHLRWRTGYFLKEYSFINSLWIEEIAPKKKFSKIAKFCHNMNSHGAWIIYLFYILNILKFRWMLACHELQPITFNPCFISDLLVSTRYHPGLSLAQWLGNPSVIGWTFHNHSLHGWKEAISIHRMNGWLCPVTSKMALVITYTVVLAHTSFNLFQ
jgi:hypothetical protein